MSERQRLHAQPARPAQGRRPDRSRGRGRRRAVPRLVGSPRGARQALAVDRPPDLKLVGTDGWISLPPIPPIFSSSLGVTDPPGRYAPKADDLHLRLRQRDRAQRRRPVPAKNKAQHSAPAVLGDRRASEFRVQLTNVGLAQRPDLFDEHTVHWHGFKNVIPFFDGEPTGSVSIPQGQTFTYVYMSHDPGTYMYHCHVEDTEHVHMGMTGHRVRPAGPGRQHERS